MSPLGLSQAPEFCRSVWASAYSWVAPAVEEAKPENSGDELGHNGSFGYINNLQVVDIEFSRSRIFRAIFGTQIGAQGVVANASHRCRARHGDSVQCEIEIRPGFLEADLAIEANRDRPSGCHGYVGQIRVTVLGMDEEKGLGADTEKASERRPKAPGSTPQRRSFEDLADDFPVIFFDAYGVLLEASGLMSPVPDLVDRLRSAGKDLYVVTNDASRPPELLAQHYVDSEGRQLIPPDRIISSGAIASEILSEKVGSGRVGYLGTPVSAEMIRRSGIETFPVHEWSPDIEFDALALLDDQGFDWQEAINRVANLLRRRPIPTVVANGDLAYPIGGGGIAAAIGTVANALEGILDTRFIRCAKPDAAMFSRAFRRAERDHTGLREEDVLMVGDTLQTDIRGGRDFGLATALVCSGHTQSERVDALMDELGIYPDFLCESVFT